MIKIITIINWIVIGGLALLIGAETLFPTKGGDAAGRGIGQAIYYLAIIAFIVLLILNLLPFNWAKYTAFGLILLPVVFIKLGPLYGGIKKWVNRVPDGYNQDGTPWFKDKAKQDLALAIYNGNINKVKNMLQGASPALFEKEGPEGDILDFAIAETSYTSYKPEEKTECVRLLFEAGARLTSDTTENSMLMAPATTGRSKLAQLLLQHGADPNARDIYYHKPVLFEAMNSYRECKETVQVLLDAGADPNAVWKDGDVTVSALIYAALSARWIVCTQLIEKGADTGYKASDGSTLKSIVEAVPESYNGDGYSTRADFEKVKKSVE